MDTVSPSKAGAEKPENRYSHHLPNAGAPYQFKPGQSGNPGGRPRKVQEATEIAENAIEAAMRKLVALIDSESEKVSLVAAQAIIDRTMGKPKQSVAHTLSDDKDIPELTTAELIGIVRSRTGAASTETSN